MAYEPVMTHYQWYKTSVPYHLCLGIHPECILHQNRILQNQIELIPRKMSKKKKKKKLRVYLSIGVGTFPAFFIGFILPFLQPLGEQWVWISWHLLFPLSFQRGRRSRNIGCHPIEFLTDPRL